MNNEKLIKALNDENKDFRDEIKTLKEELKKLKQQAYVNIDQQRKNSYSFKTINRKV